jgi:gluconate 2-dehydrogenase gamma chain
MSQPWNRRDFCRTAIAGAAALTLAPQSARASLQWRFFTDTEARLVGAIVEQIIPTDQDPGARDAGVVNYIDKQLAGFFRNHAETYRQCLIGVQQTSQALFKNDFETLAWDDQTAVLKALESGQVKEDAWKNQSSRNFFEMVRQHTMQGFYGSPRHGGNKGFASFKMIGLDVPPIVGQNRYRKD